MSPGKKNHGRESAKPITRGRTENVCAPEKKSVDDSAGGQDWGGGRKRRKGRMGKKKNPTGRPHGTWGKRIMRRKNGMQ